MSSDTSPAGLTGGPVENNHYIRGAELAGLLWSWAARQPSKRTISVEVSWVLPWAREEGARVSRLRCVLFLHDPEGVDCEELVELVSHRGAPTATGEVEEVNGATTWRELTLTLPGAPGLTVEVIVRRFGKGLPVWAGA